MKDFLNEKRIVVLTQDDIRKLGFDSYNFEVIINDFDYLERLDLLFKHLGFANLKGVQYLKEVIGIMIEGKILFITKIYKFLSDKYNTKWGVIERNIRYLKETLWYKDYINKEEFKKFLFGNLAYNDSISNTQFILAIKQFILTDFKFSECKNNLEKYYKEPAKVLCNASKEALQYPISKEKREELACFYWILAMVSESLGNNVIEIKIETKTLENGKVVLIHEENPSFTHCVSNKDIVSNVVDIINSLENFGVTICDNSLTEFSVFHKYVK